MSLLFMALIVWNIGTKKMKEIIKTSNLIVYHFSLNFGKFSVWSEYYNQFGMYQPSAKARQLSNPEAYSEPFQTSKMEFFAKIVEG